MGEEEKLFKEKELEQLEKKIAEVEKWRDEKLAEQADTPLSEMPELTVSMINSKIGDLESEVQYLIRKAKMKKAELERARLKAEADAAKAEADKKKAEKKAKEKKDESIDWSKLGDTISNYFKSEGKEGEEDTEKEKAAKDFIKETIEKDEKEKKAKEKKSDKKDSVVFPIDVDFSRALEGEEGVKKVRRTLFGRMNPYPQKKIMTFNKHQADFTFYVNYADMDYLGKAEVENVGSMNLTSVLVKGVKEALDKNLVGDNIETKGVKAHFQLDDSGILSISSVESTFEKTISPEEQEAEEAKKDGDKKDESIDWSKLGDTISNYFKSEGKEGEEDTEKEKAAKDFIK